MNIINANALAIPLPAGSVQCVVTSPPYYALRDYGVSGQLGLESSPFEYVQNMVSVFREVWRVLKDDGVLWLNLGDSYSNIGKNGGRSYGKNYTSAAGGYQTVRNMEKQLGNLKPKDMIGIPWRVAFALQDDGWYLRSDCIWAKPNPMPESVTDRPTKNHEYIFLLSKSARYFWDQEAVAEPIADSTAADARLFKEGYKAEKSDRGYPRGNPNGGSGMLQPKKQDKVGSKRYTGFNDRYDNSDQGPTRNLRTVWAIATQATKEAHFATFPEALAERCIKAGSRMGDLVFDPFTGSGTTGRVAIKLGRRFVGTELKFDYIHEICRKRTSNLQPIMLEDK
jgi:DNA modification methylase